ncbi:replication-associated recombination protein A [Patescibacteria group bacterium]|nr:replication-associated recombination protein A [Patescibacteria group bacterium]MBU1683234.1 replication-associated recombination protein A [Patescibacteria group bacterium]MBU1935629.1 replication-associated recombination protein A [Patescibacteria group bacterium]
MNTQTPLADRMRPEKLENFYGQEELIGQDSFLRQSIENGEVPSMIFWGPPGSGKTTLANIIAQKTKSDFIQMSAVTSGIKELRSVIEHAKQNKRLGTSTILFLDEIHRWNKSQQDALLPHVEKGVITIVGATTENPSFEVNSALLSRARVFVLHRLNEKEILDILNNALKDEKKGLGNQKIKMGKDVLHLIAHLSNGDARSALNTLEICVKQNKEITPELVKQVVQKSHLQYDKAGEQHYNIISALHKSIRGGNAHAGLYWLARMLEAGEDPLYIARRLLRFAAEDVGVADNFATVLANSVFDTCKKLGMPECNVHLSQLVIYLANTKKSIAAYQGYKNAKKDAEEHGNLGVPLHLRNAPTKLMKDLDYGKNYKYTPLEDDSNQKYFPEELKGKKYF